MTSLSGIDALMDDLEEKAQKVLSDEELTPIQKRNLMWQLIREFGQLERYRAALAAYIRIMLQQSDTHPPAPESIVEDLLASPEFSGLRDAIFAALLAVVYGNGPRGGWVPVSLLPQAPAPAFTFGL